MNKITLEVLLTVKDINDVIYMLETIRESVKLNIEPSPATMETKQGGYYNPDVGNFDKPQDLVNAVADIPAPPADVPAPPVVTALDASVVEKPIDSNAVISDGVELDSEGLPWDRRIHSKAKTKKKDGTWKITRGTDKDLVQQVKTELRGIVRVPDEMPAPEQDPAAVFGAEPAQIVPEVGTSGAGGAPVTGTPVPTPPATIVEPIDFGQFIKKMTVRQMEKPAFIDSINQALAKQGVGDMLALANAPHLIPVIDAELEEVWLTL